MSCPARASLPRIFDLPGRAMHLKARTECSPFFPTGRVSPQLFSYSASGFRWHCELKERTECPRIFEFWCSFLYAFFVGFYRFGDHFRGGGYPWGPSAPPGRPETIFNGFWMDFGWPWGGFGAPWGSLFGPGALPGRLRRQKSRAKRRSAWQQRSRDDFRRPTGCPGTS